MCKVWNVIDMFFYKHSVFQCEARISMLKFFTNLASKYAYLETFKRANSMMWRTPEGIKIKKILKCVPPRSPKLLT